MNKELLELLNSINEQKETVRNLVEEGKLDEAKDAKAELEKMQNKFDLLKDILDPEGDGKVKEPVNVEPVNEPKDAVADFANAARRGFKNAAGDPMVEGTPADGGYTVPEDIQTRINTYREAKASLITLVDVERVTTNKGQRTFKKRAQQTGFSKVAEGGKIGAGSTPQFERISYEIEKYAGYFPVTSELLADSDANITNVLIQWIGDESRVTRNKMILGVLDTKDKTAIASVDDIKKALNVTLGQAFKPTSSIITNDDGLQWLDTLKDADGDYLLQPNPVKPLEMRLCAGATSVPVFVVPNADLPTATNKVPMIIGDLKEAVKFFDRNQMSILSSNIASIGELNAYEMDLTLFRAIEREDCVMKDEQAFVYGQVTLGE
ncbi:phage major capsid protein [Zhenpiania hominis]|uniref:Phage major capsid protein n=1 Tax=Zhenpiania hominis TaxID=2763644 RepID=A0A923NSP2_9FIRM|nr:phage major capsid protein [Zhenpiania hominis]MBC6681323.1 phage major capsid protein [Zhenpiania hominis]